MRIADTIAEAVRRIVAERDGQARHAKASSDDAVAAANRGDWHSYREIAAEAMMAGARVEALNKILWEIFGIA